MERNVIESDREAVTTIEDAIALTGGFGTFQWIASFVCMGNNIRNAFFYFPLPYMELYPEYMCTDSENPELDPYVCEPKDFCEKDNITATVNWDANTSLHNWVEPLDLTCKSKEAIGFIGSIYFIGLMISALILPRLADIYGRRWIILGCQFMQVPVYIWVFFMSSLGECYAIFLFIGLGFGGSVATNSLYVQEFLQKRHRAKVLIAGMTIDSMCVLLLVFYFLVITKHWQGWYVMGLVLQILILIGYLWMPESPEFLFAKGRFEESKQVLLWMARVNRRDISDDMICFDHVGEHAHTRDQTGGEAGGQEDNGPQSYAINDISQGYAAREIKPKAAKRHTTGTLRELWGDKDLVVNLSLMSAIWTITSFCFYLGKF